MAIDISNSAEYAECIKQINFWYGNDAQRVIDIANQYELTPAQLSEDWLSGYVGEYTVNGQLAGYSSAGSYGLNYATPAAEAANSNAGSVTQTALRTPVETALNQSTGKTTTTSGLTSVATGLKSGLTFITKEVVPAVTAAGVGVSLGKTISKFAYDHGFNWLSWAGVDMESLNPEAWNTITKDYPDGTLKKAFNTVFGLDPNTGTTQMYADENAVAYLTMYMHQIGIFAPEEETATTDEITFTGVQPPFVAGGVPTHSRIRWNKNYVETWTPANAAHFASFANVNSLDYLGVIAASDTYNADGYYYQSTLDGAPYESSTAKCTNSAVYNGKRAYYTSSNNSWGNQDSPTLSGVGNYKQPSQNVELDKIAWTLVYGTHTQGGGIEGISNQTGATLPNFDNCHNLDDYKNALRSQYPNLYNNAVSQSNVDKDGNTKTIVYYPIGTVSENTGNEEEPITDTNNSGNTQGNTAANPATVNLSGLEELIKTLTETLSKTGNGNPDNPQNPDPTGTGDTPTVVVPTGQASALWSVYNPSQAQLNSFGAWLWSSSFIDQVLKLFNNPMQSIIGVHKIFATPATSGAGNITVGYLDSGVSANLVSNQYTDIDCGTVKVSEQFGNVFDYTDTHVRLYLPFIGIVDLDTADVMRGSVKVVYHVDVITGACLADVKVTRDGVGGTLYQFAGDAAVRYPISSGSYIGVVSGIASAIGGVASAVMTGGATLPLAAGAIAGGIGSAKTNVQHSGNFSGNAGAMGAKKPYIIIERPQTVIAQEFESYQGVGANTRRTVAQMSGYFKFSDVHTESISGAAESEIEAIRAALESGVIA